MKELITTLLVIIGTLSTITMAEAEPKKEGMYLEPYVGSPEFEKMKSLVGTWQGTHKMDEMEETPAKVTYHLTSNNSAIVETLFANTPHEMVSIYHDKKRKLSMTHYCGLANQPEMDLVATDHTTLEFNLSNDNDTIDVASEGHMHRLKISIVDNNHIVHTWTLYQQGQEAGQTIITLERVD